MKEQKARENIRQYRIRFVIIDVVMLVLVFWIVARDTQSDFQRYMLAIIVVIGALLLRNYFYSKYINAALSEEFDPEQYQANLDAGKLITDSALAQIMAAYYSRDYQKVVDICTFLLKQKRCRRYSLSYWNFLARTYFETGDLEKLRMVCTEAQDFCRTAAQKKVLNRPDSVFLFFFHYLKGEYAECREQMEKMLADPQRGQKKWNNLHFRFYCAIACYRCGDLESAAKYFGEVAQTAPKMNYAPIAQEYLNAIENGTDYQPEYRPLQPAENFTMPQWVKKRKRKRITVIVVACLYMAALVITMRLR